MNIYEAMAGQLKMHFLQLSGNPCMEPKKRDQF